MPLRKLALALTTAAALTAAGAPPAFADIGFLVMPGYAAVVLDDEEAARLDLVRGGVVIASSPEGSISLDELKPGDVAQAYDGDTPAGSATYDGTPAIGAACIGSATFTVTRGATAEIVIAGAMSSDALDPVIGTWDAGVLAHVQLPRPLVDGDMVMAGVAQESADPPVFSLRQEPAAKCTGAPVPPGPTPTTPDPGTNPPTGAPKTFAATVQASRTALGRLKLAHRTRFSLPFAFPEPGKVDLRVVAHGRTIASGTRTASGTAKVTLKLSASGRRLLQRTPRLKVTLKATFTPSRAGARPRRATVNVTLTGSSSRA